MDSWITDTLIAAIFVTISYITVKYGIIKSNNDKQLLERLFIILSLTMGTFAIISLLLFSKLRNNIIKDFQNIDVTKWFIISGFFIFIGYLFLFRGSINAPNLGYARGVLAIDLILLTLSSIILFNSKIQLIPIIGILMILFGIILISLYN